MLRVEVKKTFTERYDALQREDGLQVVRTYDKVPTVFIDQISSQPINAPVFINPLLKHTLDITTYNAHKNSGENPFTREPFDFVPINFNKNFTLEEIEKLVCLILNANLNEKEIHSYNELLVNLNIDALAIEQLNVLYRSFDPIDPDPLRGKLYLYIRTRKEWQFNQQREDFIASLEKIHRLHEIVKEFRKPVDIALPDEMPPKERADLLADSNQERHSILVRSILEMIRELNGFIKKTEVIIYSTDASEQETHEEWRRVLDGDIRLYNNLITEFHKLATDEEKKMVGKSGFDLHLNHGTRQNVCGCLTTGLGIFYPLNPRVARKVSMQAPEKKSNAP